MRKEIDDLIEGVLALFHYDAIGIALHLIRCMFSSDSWVGFVTWKLLSSITLPSGHYDLALTYTKVTILWSHFFIFFYFFF
ncbi:hypothetical protein NC651_034493 [Populus alba x Populus x berolinensis]|nr:hypothetical protein NC651_034493 [Populus alba x Populus x berolinensis]